MGLGGGGDLIGLIAKVELPNYKIPNSKSLKLSLSFLLLDCLEFACVADALNLLYGANNYFADGLYQWFRRVRGPVATQAIWSEYLNFTFTCTYLYFMKGSKHGKSKLSFQGPTMGSMCLLAN